MASDQSVSFNGSRTAFSRVAYYLAAVSPRRRSQSLCDLSCEGCSLAGHREEHIAIIARSSLFLQPPLSVQLPDDDPNPCRISSKVVGHAPEIASGISLEVQQDARLGRCHAEISQLSSILSQHPHVTSPGPLRSRSWRLENPCVTHLGMVPEIQASAHSLLGFGS